MGDVWSCCLERSDGMLWVATDVGYISIRSSAGQAVLSMEKG